MKILFVATILFLVGCSQDPQGKSFSDLDKEVSDYKTTTSDKVIPKEALSSFDLQKTLGIHEATQNSTPWLKSSADIFKLAELSFLLASKDEKNRKAHLIFGHNLMDAFYSNKLNSTQFVAESSMYLPAALGFEGERIYDKFKAIGSADDTRKLEVIFSTPCVEGASSKDFCHSLIWPKEKPNLEPKNFIVSIKNYMLRTVEIMKEQGVAAEFISGFQDKINKDYVVALDQAFDILKDVSPDRKIALNTSDLVQAIGHLKFLPPGIYNTLSTRLVEGNNYALTLMGKYDFSKDMQSDMQEIKNKEAEPPTFLPLPHSMSAATFEKGLRILNVIGNIWLDLNDSKKRFDYIGNANLVLYDALSNQSTPFIKWVAGRISKNQYTEECDSWLGGCSQENYAANTWRYGYIERLAASCHENVKNEVDAWLNTNGAKARIQNDNPDLFAILTSFQDSTYKDIILQNYKIEEQKINLEVYDSKGAVVLEPSGVAKKRTVVVKVGKFSVPLTKGRSIMTRWNQRLSSLCLGEVQTKIEGALNNYILAALDEEIRKYTTAIETIVAEQTQNSQKEIVNAVRDLNTFKSYFEKMAIPIMKGMLFGDQTLNGLEHSQVELFLSPDNKFETRRKNLDVFETGAETLGTALAAQYYRIKTLPEAKGINPVKDPSSKEPNPYYMAVFEQINKMLSMIGFRKMDKSQQMSLHRHFHGPISELDVYKYDCNSDKFVKQQSKMQNFARTKSYDDFVDWRENCEGYTRSPETLFALPDRLSITGAFDPNDNDFKDVKSASVVGQTEIIRSGSLMLQFFQDWKNHRDDYDKGMGSEVFSNVLVFPKHAFVNLTIALATLPVRGFTKWNSNLYLFNALGSEFVGWPQKGMPPPEDPVVLAAIADIFADKNSRVIRSSDLARFIVAIDEFLKATEGIEQTKATVINPPNKKVKENLNSILEGRKLLKLMMAGVSNLLTSRFQDSDGGFWHSFDLDDNSSGRNGSLIGKSHKSRTLEDQILIIDALFRTYGQWKGMGVYISALDAYHFMNNKLFDPLSGFYRSSESNEDDKILPDQFLQLILTFQKVGKYHLNAESRKQALDLAKFYEEKWLQWVQ